MKNETRKLIERWFDGLNRSDLPALLALFSPLPKIRNAANPPVEGPDAARTLLEEFFQRTCARRFELIDAAETDNQVFVAWKGELTFPSGTRIGDVTLAVPLTVPLRGADRFRIDRDGQIVELDIVHETSSILQAARAAASQSHSYDPTEIIEKYFTAEEAGDVETVVSLCDESVIIRNAAQAPLNGRDGARKFASDFKARTNRRNFTLLATAHSDGTAFAWWEGNITFKEAVAFGPVVTKRPFDITLRGVCRFKFTPSGRILELDVFHETSTPFLKAKEAASEN